MSTTKLTTSVHRTNLDGSRTLRRVSVEVTKAKLLELAAFGLKTRLINANSADRHFGTHGLNSHWAKLLATLGAREEADG